MTRNSDIYGFEKEIREDIKTFMNHVSKVALDGLRIQDIEEYVKERKAAMKREGEAIREAKLKQLKIHETEVSRLKFELNIL